MALRDGLRQLVAALLSAAAFLGLYFGLSLVWWFALALAVALYFGFLLAIPRRRAPEEILVAGQVTAADLQQAATVLSAAAGRIETASGQALEEDRASLEAMARHLRSIREKILGDPKDYRSTRRFIVSYLPQVVETVEGYAALAPKARGAQRERLREVGQRIRSFEPVIEKIDQACLENDFMALEVQVDVLATQMDRT